MIREVLDTLTEALRAEGERNVFTAFDALPAEHKGRFFTVAGIRKMDIGRPVYSPGNVYIPFTAQAEIRLLAPESAGSAALLDHFTGCTESALEDMSDMRCRLTDLTMKQDSSLGRLILCAGFEVSGLSIRERSVP